MIVVADGNAWRLVSQCATVEDVVRVFRTLASADGLTGIPVSGIGPGGGSQVRVVLALTSKASVLDGEAVVTTAPGTVSVRFVKIDARGKGLLAHMLEHKTTESPPAVPRHLVPLGAAAGTPASAKGDASMTKCVFEPMPVARAAPGAEVASTVRMPGARQSAPPTIRDSGPAGMAATAASPKREAQKTLMGMPTLSAGARAKPASVPPPLESASPVVATGTPPGGFAESTPVPKGGGELKETGPTQPTRGKGVPSPGVAAAAHAIAATPAAMPVLESAPTVPHTAPRPIDDAPTIPNEDIVTDVAVELPDLPSGDYSDPIAEPPLPMPQSQPLPQVPVYAYAPPPPVTHVTPARPGYPPMPAMQPTPMPGPAPYYPTPYPLVPQPGISPMLIERDDDMTEMVQLVRPGSRRRWPVIAVTSGVIVIGVAVMVVMAASGAGKGSSGGGGGGGGKKTTPPASASASASAPALATGSNTLSAEVPATCKVAFTSSPDAAEVVIDGKVVGTTPYEHVGSCGGFAVAFRRDKYQTLKQTVEAGATSLDVRLERPLFKVKVTSRPPGAMVKVGGVDKGKTPVVIELPGYETTSIELVKGGRTTTQRVYPDRNNEKVDVKLRR